MAPFATSVPLNVPGTVPVFRTAAVVVPDSFGSGDRGLTDGFAYVNDGVPYAKKMYGRFRLRMVT